MSRMNKFLEKIHGFEDALKEIEAGKKTSHWIWYYIPTPVWSEAKERSKNNKYALKGNDVTDFMRNDTLFTNYITMVKAISDQLKNGNDTILSTDDDNSKTQHGDLEKFLSSTEYFSKIVTDRNYVAILRQAIENANASLDILSPNDTSLKQRLNVIQNSEGTKGHGFDYEDDNNEDDDYEDNYYDENSQPLKGSFRRCYNLKRGKNGGWCAKYLGNC